MNKSELVAAVAERARLNKTMADEAIAAIIDVIIDTVKKGDTIRLGSLGTFSLKEIAARPGRNPRTGEPITIQARKTIRFAVGKSALE